MSFDTPRSARLAAASVPEDTVPISRSKPDSLHRTPARFTALALDGYGFCDILPARSTSDNSYPVSARRATTLLHVSSRQSLAVLPPASAAQRCSSAFLYHGLGSLTLGRPGRHDAGLPREEPGGGKPHARICEGESRMAELLDHNSAPPARNPAHQTYRSVLSRDLLLRAIALTFSRPPASGGLPKPWNFSRLPRQGGDRLL